MARQADQPTSMLSLIYRLLQLRRSMPALSVGSYCAVDPPGGLFAYWREHAGQRCLVVLNFTPSARCLSLPADAQPITPLLSTHLDRLTGAEDGEVILRPGEGLVLQAVG